VYGRVIVIDPSKFVIACVPDIIVALNTVSLAFMACRSAVVSVVWATVLSETDTCVPVDCVAADCTAARLNAIVPCGILSSRLKPEFVNCVRAALGMVAVVRADTRVMSITTVEPVALEIISLTLSVGIVSVNTLPDCVYEIETPPPAVMAWPDSKTALTDTAVFGMVNVAVVELGLLIVTLPDTTSHRTNLFPDVGEAVSVTVVLFRAAPEFGAAVPSAESFVVTVTWRPSAKLALTDTAPEGMVKDAAAEKRLLMLEFENPLGGVPMISQFASAKPDGGLADICTVTFCGTVIDALVEGVAVTALMFVALRMADAPLTLFTFSVTAWPVGSKMARIFTELLGIANDAGFEVESFSAERELDEVSQRTNLCPEAAVAVMLTVEP